MIRRTYCIFLIALTATHAAGQSPRNLSLSAPTGEIREGFSSVQAVRELPDRRVIVADAKDRLVWLVDFRANTATRLSRQGAGPGEYGSASALFAGPTDTTSLLDMENRRLTMFDAAGRSAG